MKQRLDYHKPVMLTQSIDGLNIEPDGIYVDITFGAGGHSLAILEKLNENGRLFAFDQDTDAKINMINDPRFTFINHNFKHIKNHLKYYKIEKVNGILGDLGISSHQLNCKNRGFSYRFDCDLDMRMDTRKSLKATDIINTYSESDLSRIFYQYGELSNAKKIAQTIVNQRNIAKIYTTNDILNSLKSFIPHSKRFKFLSRLYQSIRMEVNDEVSVLRNFLEQTTTLLNPSGRLVLISYHSLEDRLVKVFMRSGNFEDNIDKDMYGNMLTPFVMINKKAIIPDEDELKKNTKSRSAKLRIAEKK